jgi:DNA invertase Pin-like site-specific DNA recombinase
MATGKFVAYYRVSTKKQGDSGLGLEGQKEAVHRYLNGGNWTLAGEFTEVESGKNNDRPQLAAALKLCRVTGSTLVVAKLDRLSRNLAFLVNLMESKAKFVACDNPQANDLTIHILAAVAQQERKATSERTKAALAAAKARGVKLGGPDLDKNRNTDTAKATAKRTKLADSYASDLAEVIADIKAQDITSLSGVARELNERGITTRRGGKWTAWAVSLVLERLEATA